MIKVVSLVTMENPPNNKATAENTASMTPKAVRTTPTAFTAPPSGWLRIAHIPKDRKTSVGVPKTMSMSKIAGKSGPDDMTSIVVVPIVPNLSDHFAPPLDCDTSTVQGACDFTVKIGGFCVTVL